MKSRSHRLPTSDPPDDWVNGSWTVDCVCGVNFDDGEEMVNCDECGVWVHTRCSRYVKGEKLFACDKCKSKNSIRNDSEETEVAQLLVELPTKTLRMENFSHNSMGIPPPPPPPPLPPPPSRPFRLWTDIPMEERVHVQGIPGGDPGLFSGSASIFGPQLWKSTGYVPKKFHFQYRESPCWDMNRDADKKCEEEDKRNLVNKGAGVLFSLSKDTLLSTRLPASAAAKSKGVDGGDKFASSKDIKESGHSYSKTLENGSKEDGSLPQTVVLTSGKRKKEDLSFYKDQAERKNVKIVDKVGGSCKRDAKISKTVSTLSSDAKPLEFYEDSVSKGVKVGAQHSKNGNPASSVINDHSSNNYLEEDLQANLFPVIVTSEAFTYSVALDNSGPDRDNLALQSSHCIQSSSKVNDSIASSRDADSKNSIKEEVASDAFDNFCERGGLTKSIGVGLHKTELIENNSSTATPFIKDNQKFLDSNNEMSHQQSMKVKEEGVTALPKELDLLCEHDSNCVIMDETALPSLQLIDCKVQETEKYILVGDGQVDKNEDLASYSYQPKCRPVASETSIKVQNSSVEVKDGPMLTEESLRSGGSGSNLSASSQRKVVVSVGKATSPPSVIVNSRCSASDNHSPTTIEGHNTVTRLKEMSCNMNSREDNSSSDANRDEGCQNRNICTKQKTIADCNISSSKDNVLLEGVRNEEGSHQRKKIRKELSKSSSTCVSKTSHASKLSHTSATRRISESKDNLVFSSSKASSTDNTEGAPECGESSILSQPENTSHVDNKSAVPGLPQRNDKTNHSNYQTFSKVNNTPSMLPPIPSNPTTMLSDEELALLLHQELNSSPRVPRVPRMRHAGSFPQLGSPPSATMLMKRISSSGGKEHNWVTRRKNKDLSKDGSRISREVEDDAKKMNRAPFMHDQRRYDSVVPADATSKKEVDNISTKVVSSKKSFTPFSTTSSSIEVNEHNLSSTRNSPRIASDEDVGTAGRPTYHTLPGLIDEIMSKGKRMTYEELCNAVLPHWPHLRKHNGERYAYTSHSQAVLDCLRNRNEWSRLVGRGPKTSANRKRRKLDIDSSSFDSEDNESSRDVSGKDVENRSIESRKEEFPKGKRKARKRRRLALQGRGIKDIRRRKTDVLTDDDTGSYSNSSDESMFSEDEVLDEACQVGSEESASSSDSGSLS